AARSVTTSGGAAGGASLRPSPVGSVAVAMNRTFRVGGGYVLEGDTAQGGSGYTWHRHSCLCGIMNTGRNACATKSAADGHRLLLGGVGRRFGVLLVLVVLDRRLDRVLGQHRAVDLHRRQCQLLDDLRVLDAHRLVDRLALEPLGGQAARRDRGPAAE